jgi:hypothetical protein
MTLMLEGLQVEKEMAEYELTSDLLNLEGQHDIQEKM